MAPGRSGAAVTDSGPGFATATSMARAIRERETTSVELLDLHVARLDRFNANLNAVVIRNPEARARAEAADAALARGESWGPLHGVPVTIKDIFDTRGLRTTGGYPPARDNVSTSDATVTARILGAGAILLGKTNVPLLCYDWQCDSPIFGRTNNPWDPTRTPGGSTGGGAAAVAAGLSPLELGSDAAGSIRIPSHFCGVFGFKPTEHRVSGAGHGEFPGGPPRGLRHMVSYGPLARSVADLRLAVSLIEGPDGRHWEVPRAEAVRRQADAPPPDDVRLRWSALLPHAAVDEESARVVRESAARLAAAGCTMEDAAPDAFDMHDALEWWGEINGFEMGVMTPAVLRMMLRHGTYLRLGRSRWSRGLRGGLALKPRRYFAALAARDQLISGLEGFLAGFDGWLLPTAPVPAFAHTRPGSSIPVNRERTDYAMAIASYAAPFNLTGSPVVVIPAGRTADGLPIGIQLVGRRWDDDRLLAVAERVATILGGFRAPPGY